jgi:Holliday junction resolvase RusA-like endonuclease
MPIPKSMPKKERTEALAGMLKHVKKPDVDNLVKLYLDVLSGIAIPDDNCVSLGTAVKLYSITPKTVIYIEETQKILTLDEVYEGTWPTQ